MQSAHLTVRQADLLGPRAFLQTQMGMMALFPLRLDCEIEGGGGAVRTGCASCWCTETKLTLPLPWLARAP